MTRPELIVDEARAGKTLAAVVREAQGDIPWSKARELVARGKVTLDGERSLDGAVRVALGQRIVIDVTAPRTRRGVLEASSLVHVDADVCVVMKPAGLLSVPYAAGDKDTLLDITQAALRRRPTDPQRAPLGVVQRLDKDTTGLMVFARNLAAKRSLSAQLRAHTVTRRYVAIVHGRASDATYDTALVQNRGDGLRGSFNVFRRTPGKPPREARRAITHVRVLERLTTDDGGDATLVECRLETGRQHQIRIHLSEAGHPLAGEPVYIRDHDGPRIDAPRPMLHAETLGFDHPRTAERVDFSAPPPDDFERVLTVLRAKRQKTR
jgi:23S rRNA pseudouridine1911/1915/1917 synthase